MATRGEAEFARLPRLGARVYDWLLRADPIQARIADVADFLASRLERGSLLDVGTGPGWLLAEVRRLNPNIGLFGIDISAAMVQRATDNLKGIPADIRQGTIRRTDYAGDFFDAVTCVGSFYMWDFPEESLEEIWRILKKGGSAYLFEADPDCDRTAFRRALRNNLRQLDPTRRLIGPLGLRKVLKMSYHSGEISRIAARTSFAESCRIENVALGGVPMWLRITLTKTASASAGGTGA
jgi:SAM-dependent methyltransferase